MGARELLTELADLGVTVAADGDKLLIRPASKLTDDQRAALRQAKPELLEMLAGYPLTRIAMCMSADARLVLDCLLWLHPLAGALELRELAKAVQLPAGLVLAALTLLQAVGLVTQRGRAWAPAAALRRELAAAEDIRTSGSGRE